MRAARRKWLIGLELATGAAALAGGLLLAAKPDGSLLKARTDDLAGSPFNDWRAPGVLLAVLVGGGWLVSGAWQVRRKPSADDLSVVAGLGLVAFEGVELWWIGPQPLEAVFAAVGAAVCTLAIVQRKGPG